MINAEELYREIKNVWQSIYPIYFDSTKTIAEGRRIPKQLGTQEPTLEELSRAIGMCKVRNLIEPHKAYSRDFLERGRLKVEIFDKNHKPIHENMSTKRQFMKEVAKKLKQVRASKPAQQPQQKK